MSLTMRGSFRKEKVDQLAVGNVEEIIAVDLIFGDESGYAFEVLVVESGVRGVAVLDLSEQWDITFYAQQ